MKEGIYMFTCISSKKMRIKSVFQACFALLLMISAAACMPADYHDDGLTRGHMHGLWCSVRYYRDMKGRFPDQYKDLYWQLREANAVFLSLASEETPMLDAWGIEIKYGVESNIVTFASAGKDRVFRTKDDIIQFYEWKSNRPRDGIDATYEEYGGFGMSNQWHPDTNIHYHRKLF